MANNPTPRRRGRYGGLVLLALLVAVPIAAYFFLYQTERFEAATIRNFRALNSAADRVAELVGNTLPKVVENAYSKDMMEKIEGYTDGEFEKDDSCRDDNDLHSQWHSLLDVLEQQSKSTPSFTSFEPLLRRENSNSEGKVKSLQITFTLREATNTHHRAEAAEIKTEAAGIKEVGYFDSCGENKHDVKRKLLGSNLEIEDCRPLEKRSRHLHKALDEAGSQCLISRLNDFGVRSTTKLNDHLTSATEHLAAYFDKYLIADGFGRTIFNSDDMDFDNRDDIQTPHRKAMPFTNHEDILNLLHLKETNLTGGEEPSLPIGNTVIKSLRVGDVDLSIFVHPFRIQGIEAENEAVPSKDKTPDEITGSYHNNNIFYIVGIVTTADLRREAIRLDLASVVDATLLIFAGIALMPIVWFWTAGDRLVISPWMPYIMGIMGMLALLLYTVMILSYTTRSADQDALDQALGAIAKTVVNHFDKELRGAHGELGNWILGNWIKKTSKTGRTDDHMKVGTKHPSQGEGIESKKCVGQSSDIGAGTVPVGGHHRECHEALADKFFCDGYQHEMTHSKLPRFATIFLLNQNAKQVRCQFNQINRRTPHLKLGFRGYFKKPYKGDSWYPQPSGNSGDTVHDKALLHPYFIERIDSIIGGEKRTVLSMPILPASECREGNICQGSIRNPDNPGPVVGAAVVGFGSLEHTVVPPTFDYAIVEKETGRTLFHSDRRREFVTNFVRSVGNSPHLLALFDHPTRIESSEDTRTDEGAEAYGDPNRPTKIESLEDNGKGKEPEVIDLYYDGIPIRAIVAELKPEIPWRLVVYRGYEMDGSLSVATSLITIFSAGIYLFLLIIVMLFSLLLRWLREIRPGLLRKMLVRLLGVSPIWMLLWIVLQISLLDFSSHFGILVWLPLGIAMLGWVFTQYSSRKKEQYSHAIRPLTIALLVFALVIIPTVSAFFQFRSSLLCGASRYIFEQQNDGYKDLGKRLRSEHIRYEDLRDGRHQPYQCFISSDFNPHQIFGEGKENCSLSPGQAALFGWAGPLVLNSQLSRKLILHTTSDSSFKEPYMDRCSDTRQSN